MANKGDYLINKRSGNRGYIVHIFPYIGADSNWLSTIMYHIRIKGRLVYVMEGNLQRLYEIIPREGLIAR
jgi:hypothetical protein